MRRGDGGCAPDRQQQGPGDPEGAPSQGVGHEARGEPGGRACQGERGLGAYGLGWRFLGVQLEVKGLGHTVWGGGFRALSRPQGFQAGCAGRGFIPSHFPCFDHDRCRAGWVFEVRIKKQAGWVTLQACLRKLEEVAKANHDSPAGKINLLEVAVEVRAQGVLRQGVLRHGVFSRKTLLRSSSMNRTRGLASLELHT